MLMDKTKRQQQLKNKSANGKSVRCRPSCASTALSITTVIVIVATFLVWTTDFVRLVLVQNVGIENNTLSYKWWVKPPVRPYIAVYVFNYTNADQYSKGKDSKLKVQEVGPYVYRKYTEKLNVVFNSNGTVSYQEKNSFKFVPESSVNHWPNQDYLTVPNIPLLTAMGMLKDSNLLAQILFLGLSAGIEVPQFANLTTHGFLWGYEDQLFSLAATYTPLSEKLPFKKFGILVKQNGTANDRMTVNTGKQDINKLGVITRFNGEERMRCWSGEECNRIDGTDGSMFPPPIVRRNSTIHIFSGDMCRRFPLEYTEDITARYSIPGLRFRPPRNVYAESKKNPANSCYCRPDREFCPPSGIFKISPCVLGVPIMLSFPHFYLGDPRLLEAVEGLNPDPVKHDTYLDIHEELGVALDGRNRFQINILVSKSTTLSHLVNFKDNTILPIIWIEAGERYKHTSTMVTEVVTSSMHVERHTADLRSWLCWLVGWIIQREGVEDLPDEIMDLIYHLTFTARQAYLAMKWLLLLLSIVLPFLLVRRLQSHSTAEVFPDVDVVTPL